MTAPKIENRRAIDIAYIEHIGPYDKVPWEQYMERLYGWAKEQKVMPGFYPMAIYTNKPETTPPSDLRSLIAISFKGKAREAGGIRIQHLPEMKVATLSHKGPGSEFKNTYSTLTNFIEKKGYACSGAPIEIYSKKPEVKGGVTVIYAKVMIPITKR